MPPRVSRDLVGRGLQGKKCGGLRLKSGIVKWFNAKKGFGFLLVEGMETDIFVHYSVIEGEGFRTLAEGDKVDVEIGDDGKGPRALRVVPLPK